MTERIATEPQVIKDAQGIPLYVLLPYNEYMETQEKEDDVELPLEVVQLSLLDKKNLVKAWREYLGFTQKEVALRMGISQSTYAGFENPKKKVRYSTRTRIAHALGIEPEQLLD